MTKTQEKPEFAIVSQYIKDFSFEAPNSPEIFFTKEQLNANINMNIDIKVSKLNDELFNVALVFNIHNTYGEDKKTIFLIELTYCGIVNINMDEEKKDKALVTTVPSYLFPHIRALISRITSDSGFPPLVLPPIDWEARFKDNKKIH
jgi:preprotein translocase subunit SecB